MCGRFTRVTPVADIAKTFHAIVQAEEIAPSFNITPTQLVYVVKGVEQRVISGVHWGLVPSWSTDISRASSMINARSESIREKPSFRNLIARNRCVIPMNGYYEWKPQMSNGKVVGKQPYFFQGVTESEYCHDEMLAIAGLWTTWGSGDDTFISCSALTTEAVGAIAGVHNRMPFFLNSDGVDAWLSKSIDIDVDSFQNGDGNQVEIVLVSKRVNNAHNDDASLIEPDTSEETPPLTLF